MSVAPSGQAPSGRYLLTLSIAALGVVYGDVGTSPLYAIRECFHGPHGIAPTPENVLGVLSLIAWSLIIVISIKYLAYVLRADNRGEGGILALMALALSSEKRSSWQAKLVVVLGLFGAALLYGDGVITPAISVLSAIEGLGVATSAFDPYVLPITVLILVALFAIQKRGTGGIGKVFGPATLLWFVVLLVLGFAQIIQTPEVLWAIDPLHGVNFFMRNGWHGLLVLGAVFLVVTGGEALYADMGHFGVRPIRLTWFALVLPALLVNYFGQGALLLREPSARENPFYLMAPSWALYPMVVLSTLATIIASQAVISGSFSLTRQAVMLGYFPRVSILHTSSMEIGQIYVPIVNWLLMVGTIGLVLSFGSSARLAAAYGIAVTTTMVITTLLAYVVARQVWRWPLLGSVALTLVFLAVDTGFLSANAIKIADGGFVPLVIASFIFIVMTTWKRGRTLLARRVRQSLMPLETFMKEVEEQGIQRVPGTAVFMTSNSEGTPPALIHNARLNHVVHERVVLMTILHEEYPYVEDEERVETRDLGNNIFRVTARYGFSEQPDVVALLMRDDTPTPALEKTTFFLGRETVLLEPSRGMRGWRVQLFAFLTRNSLGATRFFNVPATRVLEVGSQVTL